MRVLITNKTDKKLVITIEEIENGVLVEVSEAGPGATVVAMPGCNHCIIAHVGESSDI